MSGATAGSRNQTAAPDQTTLARRMGLPLLTLYGLSVTVGAGIYVLIGETAARAGVHAPLAFLGAGLLVALSAASYAEFSSRLPVSAGEAAYVRAGLGARRLALAVGLLVCASGIVSSSALLRGGAGYVQEFITAPTWLIALVIGLVIGGIAAWGIRQSAWTAAALAIVEVGLLVAIAVAGLVDTAAIARAFSDAFTPSPTGTLFGLSGAMLIAFFAFIGFEDMVNVAEEVRQPEMTIPVAIGLTLFITSGLYFLVAIVALAQVPVAELSESKAPMTLVFQRLFGTHGELISLVAIAAVINGALVQVIMSSRVLYGLSRMGELPDFLSNVSARTRTPLNATAIVMFVIFGLSLSTTTAGLAELTSTITLLVFAAVNLSMWRLKTQGQNETPAISIPLWCPIVGFIVSLSFVVFEWLSRLWLP